MLQIFSSRSLVAVWLVGFRVLQHTSASAEPHHVLEATERVAVIGAGSAGSSTAYHLKQFALEAGIKTNITIFEKNDYIGGRSTTVNAWDDPSEPVELGGSIFVKVNKILVEAAERFNLNTSRLADSPTKKRTDAAALGIWNGHEFVFEQSSSSSFWWDLAKLLWRYGYSPIKTNNLMKEVVGKFLNMYEEPYFPWESLTQVAYDLGLTAVTSATGEQYLNENRIDANFAKEIVQASTRVNYAQNLPLIHGLETMVCMAAQGAMAVEGGNWQIFDHWARSSATSIQLSTAVQSITAHKNNTYTLTHQTTDTDAQIEAQPAFDTVVLAGPYQFANLEISPELEHTPDTIPYVALHVTLFASPNLLSPAAFNLAPDALVPQVILTTLHPSEHPGSTPAGAGKAGFYSISTLREGTNPATGKNEYLYKVFSAEQLSDAKIAQFLGLAVPADEGPLDKEQVSWVYRKLWHSYPYEYPRVTFEPLRLDEKGLWYTGGMESFIATMETAALMGRNVAKLIVDEWVREREEKMVFKGVGQQVVMGVEEL